ncbi:hypothetical protein BC829DRAFT_441264 [Chytridium lagenaria]|nr:hypothetical protein BC829DRAFT_441264 [Chytridium lagenaria]
MADLGQISGYGAHVEEKKFTEKKFTKTLEPDPDSSTVSKRSHLSAFDTLPAPELNPSPRKKTHRSLEVSGHHRSDAFTKLLERHDLSPEAAEYSCVEKVLGFIEAMKTVDGVQPDRETYVAAAKA